MPQNYAKIVKTTPFLVFAPIKNMTEDMYGFWYWIFQPIKRENDSLVLNG